MHSTVFEHVRCIEIHLVGSGAWSDVRKYVISIFVHIIGICVRKSFGTQFEYNLKPDSAIGRK